MTRAGQQPALALILVVAGVIGFGIGTWLGNVTRPNAAAAAVQVTPSIVISAPTALPSPSPTASPSQSPAPTEAPPAQPQQVILTLEGESHDVSESFEVKPGWQILWQIDGTSIAVAVTGEQNLGVLIEEEGPASGVTGIAQGGVFRLEVAANGPWSIRVIDGEEAAPSG